MKKLSLLIIILILGASYIHAREKGSKFPLPDHLSTQFAGNIGFISVGIGYKFLNKKWQTDLMVGYVPYELANTEILTVAWKNTFQIYKFQEMKTPVSFHGAFSVNWETGNNSELVPTKYYPKGYYGTNSFRGGLFLGSRINIPTKFWKRVDSIDFGIEVCTLASYVYYNIVSQDERYDKVYSISFHTNINF